MASTEEVLRDIVELGPMYKEFMGELQRDGVPGAVRAKERGDLYIEPFDRGGHTVDEETRRMLEEIVRQASQEHNPKTPSLEEFLRQVFDGSPADIDDKHSRMTAHERLTYGEDLKSLIGGLVDRNTALAQKGARATELALKAMSALKALSEEKAHEHKFDEKGECDCGNKKAMSEPRHDDEERKAAEAAQAAEARERAEHEKEKDEALARVLNGLDQRLAGIEKSLGVSPVGRSAEAGAAPTDTSMSGIQGVLARTTALPTAPDGAPAGVTARGVSESAIKAFTDEAMAIAMDKGMSPIDSQDMRKEILGARAAWQLSTARKPPQIENHQIRALAKKHGLPIFEFGK